MNTCRNHHQFSWSVESVMTLESLLTRQLNVLHLGGIGNFRMLEVFAHSSWRVL